MGPDRGATRFSGWFSGSADGAESEIHARLRPSLRAGSVAIEEHDHAGDLTPELDALRQAFTERGFEVEELQAIIDGLVERVRSAIEEGTG